MIRNYSSHVINEHKVRTSKFFLLFLFVIFSSIVLNAQADLSIVKTVDNDTPNVGDQITFTITLSNAGPNIATGVTVRDIVPNGYGDFVNISNGNLGNNTAGVEILWPNLTVPVTVNPSDAIVLTVTVTVLNEGDYNNRAEVIASDQIDPDSDPNLSFDTDDGRDGVADLIDDDESPEVVVVPMRADLSLTKTVDNANPEVGGEVTFTITLMNSGPDIATGVAIRDVVPSGYGNLINVSNGGASLGSTVIWSGITINPGQSINFTITATVLPTGEYDNRAEIIASDVSDPDSDPTLSFDEDDNGNGNLDDDDDETGFVEVDPLVADLSIEKDVDNSTPNIGREVEFTITVTNNGPLDASNIVISDQLTTGFIYVSDDSLGDYNATTGEWTISNLPNGDSAFLTIRAVVSLVDNYVNTASVLSSGSFDPNQSNNTATVTLDPEEVFYPEGFSPNGDNINDTFEIPGLGYLYPNFKMEIYTRWGNKVFDYVNNARTQPLWWDGFSNGNLTFNGSKQVPTGTYYYIIYFNQDNKEPISNWIYLNR